MVDVRMSVMESKRMNDDIGAKEGKDLVNSMHLILSPKEANNTKTVPWFPRNIQDLNRISKQVPAYGADIDSDPGFTDMAYRARTKYIAELAYNYKYGQPIARVEYTEEEIKTWGQVFRKMSELYPKYACREYNEVFQLLVDNCILREDNIPQLENISNFLKDRTGFTIRPADGYVAPRDFLAGLAFRIYYSTQFIRHGSRPLFTPKPDICHEVLGHVPFLADPELAQLMQIIGLASLGAPDEFIEKLDRCFWFTFDFGLCRQNGELKAYGGGLLSSFGELEYSISDAPELRPFDPAVAALQEHPMGVYQPIYYVAESFEDAKEKIIKFIETSPRDFKLRYDSNTQSVSIVTS